MKTTASIAAAATLLAAAGAANAAIHTWNWNAGDPGNYGINNNGGIFESINASFDDASNMMTWTTTFANQVTQGFTLATSAGPNPKGHAGELALLYFDASDTNNCILTAYAYNGKNTRDSFKDGNGNVAGNQTPDLIMDSSRVDWIVNASVTDTIDGKRIMSFTVNASDINSHSPMYPDAVDPWFGIGFGNQLGLWMHPYRTFDPTYDPQTGAITSISTGGEGWFDGHSFDSPTPGSFALLTLAGAVSIKRRRH